MCSKTDSEATYCPEVEEMLAVAAASIPLNKSSNNLPLRRSQRLSQKHNKTYIYNKNTAQNTIPAASGVPLDLSHKSKESYAETSELAIDGTITAKTVLGLAKTNEMVWSQKPINKNQMVKKEALKTQQNAKRKRCRSRSQRCRKYGRSKKVNNVNNISPKSNALDLLNFPKLELLQNNKQKEEEALFSHECSPSKVAHSQNAIPGKTNRKTLVNASYPRVVSMGTTEDIQLSEVTKNKPIALNLSEKCTVKRGQKRKLEPDEIDLKHSRNQNTYQKPEKLLVETNAKTPNFDVEVNIENSFQTKIKPNSKKSTKRQSTDTTLAEIQTKRQRQTALVKKPLCRQITANSNLENKIKAEKISQKSYEEGIQTNNYTQQMPLAAANKVCSQFEENKFDAIGVKHEHQDNKFRFAYKVELKTENFQPKNYIKSFDRNQFLDKIQSARSYSQHLPVEMNNLLKTNTFEIPPTPAESSEEHLKNAILYKAYPPHFKHQLPPEAILTSALDPQQPLPTPDATISLELLDSSSSSPSLPESLCELFKTNDIKDILNVKKTSYRLNSYHIQALALMLNLRIDYLLKMMDKVVNTSPAALKNIEKVVNAPFVLDNDLFSTSSKELWDSSNIVPNSQSPRA